MRDAQQQIDFAQESLGRHVRQRIDHSRQRLLHLARALQDRSPARELSLRRNRFTDLQRRLDGLPPVLLDRARERFNRVTAMLRVLGPHATLGRGYSITTDATGKLIRSSKMVHPSMKIRTRLSDGEFESTV
jgi:exodeoxyribonuclease VII large subunit